MRLKGINPQLLKNKEIAEEALIRLLDVREELDDFIENLEFLSDDEFNENMEIALREYENGETESGSVTDLRKRLYEEL